MNTITLRAFAVWWKDFERWSVSYFRSGCWYWPPNILKRVADFTNPETLPITVSEAQKQNIPIISKINFGGELFLRNSEDYSDYKGRLFLVKPNRFIFSKINAKRGCIYFAPEYQKPFAVSSEYPVLNLDANRVLGDYLNLVMRVGPAREALVGFAAGMAKARTNLKDFQNIKIPLPSLAEQKTIVARWRKAQDKIAAARERAEKRKTSIDTQLFVDLGLRSPVQDSRPKAFAVWWKEAEKWGTRLIYLNCQHRHISKFREVLLSELCKIGSGGTPLRSDKRYFGGSIPWVKTTEVRDEEITSTKESLTNEGLRNSSAKVYPKGSLLIAMYGQGATRGRTAKLAIDAATNQACAVLYNIDSRVETDFLWYFLMSQYEAIRALASGNNQPNLNAEMITNLRIPLPPLSVQKQIMERVATGRKEIVRERETADHFAHDINTEVEALILGTKKVSEL